MGTMIDIDRTSFSRNNNMANEVAVLFERLRVNDENAFSELYEKTKNYVYYTVLKSGVTGTDAEDVMQDVFFTVFKNHASCKDPQSGLAWIKRIAHNKAIDYLRKESKVFLANEDEEEYIFEDSQFSAPIEMPEDIMENKETQRLVAEIINNLPNQQLTVIRAFYFNEMKTREIADAYGIPEGTVKTNLIRGRKKIEKEVLELARKHGTKLFAIGIIPVLGQIFAADALTLEISTGVATAVYTNAALACGVETVAAGGTAAGVAIATKILIGVLALGAVGGGAYVATGGFGSNQKNVANSSETQTGVNSEVSEKAKLSLTEKYNSIVNEKGKGDLEYTISYKSIGPRDEKNNAKINIKQGVINNTFVDVDKDGIPELLAVETRAAGDILQINVIIYKYNEKDGTISEIKGIRAPSEISVWNRDQCVQCAYEVRDDGFYVYFTNINLGDNHEMIGPELGIAWGTAYKYTPNDGITKAADVQYEERRVGNIVNRLPKNDNPNSFLGPYELKEVEDVMPNVVAKWREALANKKAFWNEPDYSKLTINDLSYSPLYRPLSESDSNYTDLFTFYGSWDKNGKIGFVSKDCPGSIVVYNTSINE